MNGNDQDLNQEQDQEESLALKKRARRRLLGAATFVLLAVTLLPMVMDNEPQRSKELEINIPGQETQRFINPAASQAESRKEARSSSSSTRVIQNKPRNKQGRPQARASTNDVVKKTAIKTAAKPKPKAKPKKTNNKKSSHKSSRSQSANKNKGEARKTTRTKKAEDKVDRTKKAEVKQPAARSRQKKAHAATKTKSSDNEARAAAILSGANVPAASTDGKSTTGGKASANKKFHIAIGAFARSQSASDLRNKLDALGIASYLQPANVNGKNIIRVRAGPFASRAAAKAALGHIQAVGIGKNAVISSIR